MQMISYFSSETMEARRQWETSVESWKKKIPSIHKSLSAKYVTNQRKTKTVIQTETSHPYVCNEKYAKKVFQDGEI